jgi:hypothetical protein
VLAGQLQQAVQLRQRGARAGRAVQVRLGEERGRAVVGQQCSSWFRS